MLNLQVVQAVSPSLEQSHQGQQSQSLGLRLNPLHAERCEDDTPFIWFFASAANLAKAPESQHQQIFFSSRTLIDFRGERQTCTRTYLLV